MSFRRLAMVLTLLLFCSCAANGNAEKLAVLKENWNSSIRSGLMALKLGAPQEAMPHLERSKVISREIWSLVLRNASTGVFVSPKQRKGRGPNNIEYGLSSYALGVALASVESEEYGDPAYRKELERAKREVQEGGVVMASLFGSQPRGAQFSARVAVVDETISLMINAHDTYVKQRRQELRARQRANAPTRGLAYRPFGFPPQSRPQRSYSSSRAAYNSARAATRLDMAGYRQQIGGLAGAMGLEWR